MAFNTAKKIREVLGKFDEKKLFCGFIRRRAYIKSFRLDFF